VFGTDRGLCGSFNTTLFRHTIKWIKAQEDMGRSVEVWAIGKKAAPYFTSRGCNVSWAKADIKNDVYMDAVREIGERLKATFVSADVQEVFLGFNTFKNVLMQPTTFSKLLPMTVETTDNHTGGELTMIDYKYEPDASAILDTLVPLYMQTIIHQSFLETEAGEHASRMTAMDNATRNASDIIDNLTLLYNRARQAAITTELIEIVAGAEAL
jgi:F-type H+-transporting ATPase subunit gamma